jgi:hypothetical protein
MSMHVVVTGANDTTAATATAVANMQGGNVHLVTATTVADILAACKGIGPIATIDIVGHGGPGYVELGSDPAARISCAKDDVLNLAKLVQVLKGNVTTLRLLGCSTALHGADAGTDGPVLLAWLAHAMPSARIVAMRTDFTGEMFDGDGITLTDEFMYGVEHGDAIDTIPEAVEAPEEPTPVSSPIDEAWRSAARAHAPGLRPLGRWLEEAAHARCFDATLRLTAFRKVLGFSSGGVSWRLGFARKGLQLMVERDADKRFIFPSVTARANEIPAEDT